MGKENKEKADTFDVYSNRYQAKKLLMELKQREIKMANSKKVYHRDGAVVTVYGNGVALSIVDADKRFEELKDELNINENE